jgi:hypothetical protein
MRLEDLRGELRSPTADGEFSPSCLGGGSFSTRKLLRLINEFERTRRVYSCDLRALF